MSASRCAVLVFAKAPVAGYAKTRLAPALGDGGAARLAERLLQHTVNEACAAGVGPVTLCCAPDAAHPAFTRLAQTHGVALAKQCAGDLGMRMADALIGALRLHFTAVLIGTDAPQLDAAYLRDAAKALLAHDAVFGPATDGGYALVGLRGPANGARGLFDGIAWSTAQVMAQTRQRLQTLRLSHVELAPLADIDEPADLQHLPAGWVL
jgi:rSAM/selenodomain-associated transferase 1